MAGVLPSRFLFRYAFPVQFADCKPRQARSRKNALRTFPFGVAGEFELPALDELDDAEPIGRVFAAWSDSGFAVAAEVSGKQSAPECNPGAPAESDGLQVWIDTRNTQSIHRASRYCHHFCLLPAGGGETGDEALGVQLPIARSREETDPAEPEEIQVTAEVTSDGYRLEARLPAEILLGYDPEANPRLGFYYVLRDAELGERFLTVGSEFPYAHDPSVWSTLELVR